MSILIVTGIEGARNCAAVMEKQIGMEVDVAEGCKAALSALRQHEYSVVVIDDSVAGCDPTTAERICDHAGLAVPLQINFAITGATRLVRAIRAAQHRRERELALARRAAAAEVGTELKGTVASILLNSELALKTEGVPAQLTDRLRAVADRAEDLRRQLSAPAGARISNTVTNVESGSSTMIH